MANDYPTIVDCAWVAHKISTDKNLRVLDASWHMPFAKRNAKQEYYHCHIPTAQFFDIDECCDNTYEYSEHMLPTKTVFEEYMGKLGINNRTNIVVYDNNPNFGLYSAQRVWWTLRAFGHTRVSVLDGGMPAWNELEYDTTDEIMPVQPQTYKALFNPNMVATFDEIEANIYQNSFILIDARSTGRFEGSAPEPRWGIKSGHIPGAINIPFTSFMEKRNLKSVDQIREIFEQAGVDLNSPVPLVSMCGTGVASCLIPLVAHLCGRSDVRVYDGSWMEWCQRSQPDQRISVQEY